MHPICGNSDRDDEDFYLVVEKSMDNPIHSHKSHKNISKLRLLPKLVWGYLLLSLIYFIISIAIWKTLLSGGETGIRNRGRLVAVVVIAWEICNVWTAITFFSVFIMYILNKPHWLGKNKKTGKIR